MSTPPIIDIFKLRGQGLTGAVTVEAGVVTNITPGAAGHVLTSDGTNWVSSPGGGGGANQSLSNLTNPTAINQDLIFSKSNPLVQSPDNFTLNSNSSNITSYPTIPIQSLWNDLSIYVPASGVGADTFTITFASNLGQSIGIVAADNPDLDGLGGQFILGSGSATNGNANGGQFVINSGSGVGTGNGGNIRLRTGAGGGPGVSGNISLEGHQLNLVALDSSFMRVTGVEDPTSAQDAATKAYVDSHAPGPYTSFTIANNQVSPADVTGFLVDNTINNAFSSEYSILRNYPGIPESVSEDSTYYSNLISTGTGASFAGGTVLCSAIQADGKTLQGGTFTTLNGNTRVYLVRINTDGTEDTTFATNLGTGFTGGVGIATLAVQADQKILVGGVFTQLNGNNRGKMLRLNADGTDDTTFYSNLISFGVGVGFNAEVNSILVQADQKIVVLGEFTLLNTIARKGIVRLNSDGTEDTTFHTNTGTGFSSGVGSSIVGAIQSDQKIVIAGGFPAYNSNTRTHIVRLNTDGTEDTTFYTNTSGGFSGTNPTSVLIQSDQKIVVSGNGSSGTLQRYNTDGTPDTTFNANIGAFLSGGPASGPNWLALQSSQQIIAIGPFDTYNGNSRGGIIRLNTNGTEDTTFYGFLGSAYSGSVNAAVIQSDNSIVISGGFFTFNGLSRINLMRLIDVAATATVEEVTQNTLRGIYLNTSSTWVLGGNGIDNGVSNAGVTFSMLPSGQLQYTSTNIAGTLVTSEMRFIIGSKL